MTFEDLNPYDVASGYTCTNEEPDLMRRLLRSHRRPFKRVAAIASSGEVVLFTILPRAQEVIAVDHSYGSLTAFYLKMLLLESIGPKALKALISTGTHANLVKAIEPIEAKLPPPLLERIAIMRGGTVGYNKTGPSGIFSQFEHTNLRREWYYASERALAVSAKRLDRITLVHGDFTDIAPRGPFDLLYLSNAHEHTGRGGKRITQAVLDPLLTPKGLALSANVLWYDSKGSPPHNWTWKHLQGLRGYRSTWTYNLYRRATAKAKVAKVQKVKP